MGLSRKEVGAQCYAEFIRQSDKISDPQQREEYLIIAEEFVEQRILGVPLSAIGDRDYYDCNGLALLRRAAKAARETVEEYIETKSINTFQKWDENQKGISWDLIGEATKDDKYFLAPTKQIAEAMKNSNVPRYIKPFVNKDIIDDSSLKMFTTAIRDGVYEGVIITIHNKTNLTRPSGYAIIKGSKDPTMQKRATEAIGYIEKLKNTAATKKNATKHPAKKNRKTTN